MAIDIALKISTGEKIKTKLIQVRNMHRLCYKQDCVLVTVTSRHRYFRLSCTLLSLGLSCRLPKVTGSETEKQRNSHGMYDVYSGKQTIRMDDKADTFFFTTKFMYEKLVVSWKPFKRLAVSRKYVFLWQRDLVFVVTLILSLSTSSVIVSSSRRRHRCCSGHTRKCLSHCPLVPASGLQQIHRKRVFLKNKIMIYSIKN